MAEVRVEITKHRTRFKRAVQWRWTAYAANGRKVACGGESYANLDDLHHALRLLGLE